MFRLTRTLVLLALCDGEIGSTSGLVHSPMSPIRAAIPAQPVAPTVANSDAPTVSPTVPAATVDQGIPVSKPSRSAGELTTAGNTAVQNLNTITSRLEDMVRFQTAIKDAQTIVNRFKETGVTDVPDADGQAMAKIVLNLADHVKASRRDLGAVMEALNKRPPDIEKALEMITEARDAYPKAIAAAPSPAQAPPGPLDIPPEFAGIEQADFAKRHAAARDPATPQAVLVKLANDDDPGVRQAVAVNRSTPKEIRLNIISSERMEAAGLQAYAGVDKITRLSDHDLGTLAQDSDPDVRREVARHLRMPTDPISMNGLCQGNNIDVLVEVARNKRTTVEQRETMAFMGTSPRVLAVLAQDPMPGVRMRVGQNENTLLDVKAKLAADKEPAVRSWVAQSLNPHTSAQAKALLDKLAKDEYSAVREAAQASLNKPKP